MKNFITYTLITLMIFVLFFTSFMLGASDGCRDAGYNTFAIGKYGIYCLNQDSFEPLDAPVYTERDL